MQGFALTIFSNAGPPCPALKKILGSGLQDTEASVPSSCHASVSKVTLHIRSWMTSQRVTCLHLSIIQDPRPEVQTVPWSVQMSRHLSRPIFLYGLCMPQVYDPPPPPTSSWPARLSLELFCHLQSTSESCSWWGHGTDPGSVTCVSLE